MYQTRQALIAHLQSADVPADQTAAAIRPYAGEFSREGGRQATTLRIDLPAILVAFDIGRPFSHVPEHMMSVLFAAETRHLDRQEAEKDALLFAGEYGLWLLDNNRFEDESAYYSIVGAADTRIETLLIGHKYTVLGMQVTISVDRQT